MSYGTHYKSDPEVDLLLQCATTHPNAARLSRIEYLLSREIDWKEFLRLATFHRIDPLVHQAIERTSSTTVPADVREHLTWSFHSTAANNLLSVNELQRVVRLLNDHGLRSLTFKGPVLATIAYESLAARPSLDLDIMVEKSDFAQAAKILTADRYFEYEKVGSSPIHKALHMFVSQQAAFVDGVIHGIDLHTSVLPPGYRYAPSFDDLLERSQVVQVANTSVRTFSNEDLLLILCHHGAKNRWELIKYMCDVGELIRAHPELDWDAVLHDARRSHSERILFLGLYLARELLDAKVPQPVEREMESEPVIKDLAAKIKGNLRQSHITGMDLAERMRFFLMLQNTIANKVRYGIYTLLRRVVVPESHASRA